MVEDDEECESISTDEVKKAIIQLTEREKHNPLYNHTEKYIRVKHKTYVPVEVCKDRNGRMIYNPLKSISKPELSLGVELRTLRPPDDIDQPSNEKHSTGLTSTHDRSPDLSFGETKRPQFIDETCDEELTEVEYPACRKCNKKVSFPIFLLLFFSISILFFVFGPKESKFLRPKIFLNFLFEFF